MQYQVNANQGAQISSRFGNQLDDQNLLQAGSNRGSVGGGPYDGAGPASGQINSSSYIHNPQQIGNIPFNQLQQPQKQINISDIQNLSPKALLNWQLEAGGPGLAEGITGHSPPHIGAAAIHNLSENSRIAGNSSSHYPGTRNTRKKHLNENSLTQALDRDKYKEELLWQMKEKKERERQEKQRRNEEEIQEEYRIKKEVQELNQYYQENRSERDNDSKGIETQAILPNEQKQKNQNQEEVETVVPRFSRTLDKGLPSRTFKNKINDQLQQTLDLNREPFAMETNMISDIVNPRKIAQDKQMNKPLNHVSGQIAPPTSQEVQSQLALEQNMNVFNSSIAQMRQNHANLIRQYNLEMMKLTQQREAQADTNYLQENAPVQPDSQHQQIQNLQSELEKIIQVIEQAGGSILARKEQVAIPQVDAAVLPQIGPRASNGDRPQTPKSQIQKENGANEQKLTKSHLKKRKILVNFDAEPTNQQNAAEQDLPQIDDIPAAQSANQQMEQPIQAGDKQSVHSYTRTLATEQVVQGLIIHEDPGPRLIISQHDSDFKSNGQQLPPLQPSRSQKSLRSLKSIKSQKSLKLENVEMSIPRQSMGELGRNQSVLVKSLQAKSSQKAKRNSQEGLQIVLCPLPPKGLSRQSPQLQMQQDEHEAFKNPSIESGLCSARVRGSKPPSKSDLIFAPIDKMDQMSEKVDRLNTSFMSKRSQRPHQLPPLPSATSIPRNASKDKIIVNIDEIMAPNIISQEPQYVTNQAQCEPANLQQAASAECERPASPANDAGGEIRPQNEDLGMNLDQRSHSDFNLVPVAQQEILEMEPLPSAIPDEVQALDEQIIQETQQEILEPKEAKIEEHQMEQVDQELNEQPSSSPQTAPQQIKETPPSQDQTAEINRHQKMKEILGDFVETKKQNQEPIVIKMISDRTKGVKPNNMEEPQQIPGLPQATEPEAGEKILVENGIDPSMFEQRANLRNAINETNLKESLKMDQDHFYDAKRSKLYAAGSQASLKPLGARQVQDQQDAPDNGNAEELGKHLGDPLYKSIGAQDQIGEESSFPLGAAAHEVISTGSGLFTTDSKINDYQKRNSFYEKQHQLQEIAFKKKGHLFGCYGPVILEKTEDKNTEENNLAMAEDDKNLNSKDRSEDHFIKQRPVKYNKNDPFSVNMRLRQSLSNTNRILFKQDNQRYIESIAQLDQNMLMPRSSLQQLNELNSQREQNRRDEPQYDENLFRDENAQVQSRQGQEFIYSANTLGDAGAIDPKEQERQMALREARALKRRVALPADVYGRGSQPDEYDRVAPVVRQPLQPMWFDFTDQSREMEQVQRAGLDSEANQIQEVAEEIYIQDDLANADEQAGNEPTPDANTQAIENHNPEIQGVDPALEANLQPAAHTEEIPPPEELLGTPADPEAPRLQQSLKPDIIEKVTMPEVGPTMAAQDATNAIEEQDAGGQEEAFVWEYDEEYYEEAELEQESQGVGEYQVLPDEYGDGAGYDYDFGGGGGLGPEYE